MHVSGALSGACTGKGSQMANPRPTPKPGNLGPQTSLTRCTFPVLYPVLAPERGPEWQTHARRRNLGRVLREGNQPVTIALLPSRGNHFPETPARVGQSCRKLSMSESCAESLAIRCKTQARAAPSRKAARGVCGLRHAETSLSDMRITQVLRNSRIGRAGESLTVRRSAGFSADRSNSTQLGPGGRQESARRSG